MQNFIKLDSPTEIKANKVVAFPQNKSASTLKQFNEIQELKGLIARKTLLVRDLTINLGLAEATLALLTAKINKLENI